MRTQQYNVIGHFYGMVQHALISILSYKKDLAVQSSREERVKNMLLHFISSDLEGKIASHKTYVLCKTSYFPSFISEENPSSNKFAVPLVAKLT